ncbi:unknown [Coraliomargarita sp. CAG:312]|nr:unknown [Coraliomargarita sp. CAG:312]
MTALSDELKNVAPLCAIQFIIPSRRSPQASSSAREHQVLARTAFGWFLKWRINPVCTSILTKSNPESATDPMKAP